MFFKTIWMCHYAYLVLLVLQDTRLFLSFDLFEKISWSWLWKRCFENFLQNSQEKNCARVTYKNLTLHKSNNTWVKNKAEICRSLSNTQLNSKIRVLSQHSMKTTVHKFPIKKLSWKMSQNLQTKYMSSFSFFNKKGCTADVFLWIFSFFMNYKVFQKKVFYRAALSDCF